MKKKIVIILILFVFFNTVYALTAEEAANNLPLENIGSTPFENITLKGLTDDILNGKWDWNIGRLMSAGISIIFNSLYNNLSLVITVFAVAVISSMLLNLKSSAVSGVSEGGFYAVYIIAAGLCSGGVGMSLEYGSQIASELNLYIKTLIPVVMSVSVASGAVISGAVVQPLIIAVSQLITFVIVQWLLPALTIICAMCIVDNMSNKADLSGIINFLQKAIRWSTGTLMTLFVGIMTIQCMITPALDSVSGKLARYTIANFVPVVGGIISDSISVVAGYSSVLKGAVGGAGIIIGVLMCIKPLAEIASVAVLYTAAAAFIRPVCDKRISGLMSSLAQVVITLLILLIMMMLMFIINVTSAVNIGGFTGVGS